MEFKKYIHHDTDLEKAIVGICLLEREALNLVGDILEPEMFYHIQLGKFWRYLLDMKKRSLPIDLLTATNYIVNQEGGDKLPNGQTISYALIRLTNDVCQSTNLVSWANIVKSLFIRREWVKIKAEPTDDLEAMLSAQDRITKLTAVSSAMEFKSLDDAIIDLYRHMAKVEESQETGIPTGCKKLDLLNGGFTGGQFIVLAARPSVGKSAYMGKAALDAAEKGYNVGLISLEMPREQIAARLGSIVSGLDFWRIFRAKLGDDREREESHRKLMQLAGRSIFIADKVQVTLGDIRAAAYRLKRAGRLDILYIDYLQLVDTTTGEKNQNREREVALLSRGLKVLALELKIPIVALAQLNRDIEKGPMRLPKLSDLRESGSLEQDADAVIFIHRDFKAGLVQDEAGNSTDYYADIVVSKWRNGETGGGASIKMGFDGPKMQFLDVLGAWEDYASKFTGQFNQALQSPKNGLNGDSGKTEGARLFIEPPKQGELGAGSWRRVDRQTGELLDDEPF